MHVSNHCYSGTVSILVQLKRQVLSMSSAIISPCKSFYGVRDYNCVLSQIGWSFVVCFITYYTSIHHINCKNSWAQPGAHRAWQSRTRELTTHVHVMVISKWLAWVWLHRNDVSYHRWTLLKLRDFCRTAHTVEVLVIYMHNISLPVWAVLRTTQKYGGVR